VTVAGPGERPILSEVGFDLARGESVILWGPSGAGKTTLLRVLAGLRTPARGEVAVLGEAIAGEGTRGAARGRASRARVALIPQHLGLVLERTALDNVLCGALGRLGALSGLVAFPRKLRERARGHLRRLGLEDRADVPVRCLSGGERQRVSLARALMQEPAVILADEPVASLDHDRARDVLALLREVSAESGAALVTVLHDDRLAAEHAPRLLAIAGGRLLHDGETRAFFAKRAERRPAGAHATGPCTLGEDCRCGEHGGQENRSRVAGSEEGGPHAARREEDLEPLPSAPPGGRSIRRLVGAGVALASVAALVASVRYIFESAETRWEYAAENAVDVVSRFFPPDVSAAKPLLGSLLETLAMAFLGTLASLLLSAPLAFLAASNLAPRAVRAPTRLALNALRTVPSLVWGLLAVATLGLGALSGTVALAIYSTGYLGRFFYESLESLPRATQEVLHAAGASRLQVFRHAAVPEALPQLLSHVVFMLEYNIRSGSVLGIVGAGGVGFYLHTYLRSFDYPKATTALVVIFLVVVVCDAVGGFLRAHLRRT
jgi:phosphonate transport system permease protein